jgi:hypothetical protein
MTRTVFAIVTFGALTASGALAQEGPILDREFMIGPRVGVEVVGLDLGAESAAVHAPLLDVELDMRKEFGGSFMQIDVGFAFTVDGEHGSMRADFAYAFYLTEGATAPYLGGGLALRVSDGPYDVYPLAIGMGPKAVGGVMFDRTSSIRFYVDAQLGLEFGSYMSDPFGNPTPPSFLRYELLVAPGVGF